MSTREREKKKSNQNEVHYVDESVFILKAN